MTLEEIIDEIGKYIRNASISFIISYIIGYIITKTYVQDEYISRSVGHITGVLGFALYTAWKLRKRYSDGYVRYYLY